MFVKTGGKRGNIPLEDIVLMEKEKRKIIAHTKRGIVSFYGKFDELKQALDGRFASPHRSYMINMDYIISLDKNMVEMETGHRIFMCRSCMRRLKIAYDKYVSKKLANH